MPSTYKTTELAARGHQTTARNELQTPILLCPDAQHLHPVRWRLASKADSCNDLAHHGRDLENMQGVDLADK